MPRIRTIKPNFWEHEDIAKLPPMARLLFIASWNFADDEGRLRWNPAWLARVFPYDLERGDITFADLREWMALLEHYRMLQSYVAEDGQRYAWIVNFRKHQVIPKATASRLPAPPELDVEPSEPEENPRSNVTQLTLVEDSGSTPVVLPEPSGVGSRKKEVGSGRETPPLRGGVTGGAAPVGAAVAVASPPAPAKATGTRLSEDWRPTLETMTWSRSCADRVDITNEWAKFQDYWMSKAGAGARKVDWDRTWKNWLRKAAADAQRWTAPRPSPRAQRLDATAALIQKLEQQETDSAAIIRRAIQ